MHETFPAVAALNPAASTRSSQGRFAQLSSGLLLTVLVAMSAIGGCDDGEDGGQADAAVDAASTAQCRQVDCASIALPKMACDNGGILNATCARGTDQRCTWTQLRCSIPPGSEATIDASGDGGGVTDGRDGDAGDGGPPDAVEAGDAVDAADLDAMGG